MSLMTIKNKVSGAEYPVTSEEWEKMEKLGRGTKLFTVVSTAPERPLIPLRKQLTVPAEVQRVPAKNEKAALPEAHKSPEQDA